MILQKSIRTFWDAVQAKDTDGIDDAYIKSEDTYVILEGPRFSTHGFEKISKGWKDFGQSGISLESIVWVEGPFEEVTKEMGWIGGIIDISITVNGKTFTTRFRCSFVLVPEEGHWKIKHEHVSAPLEDPYGIGDWLKK